MKKFYSESADVIANRFCVNKDKVEKWLRKNRLSFTDAVYRINQDFEKFLSEVINLKS